MKKELLGLRTVVYHVGDLGKAKEWYAALLGIEPYFDQPYYVGFSVGGYELGLDPDMTGVKMGNNSVAYWGVDNLAETMARLRKLGVMPKGEIMEVGEGIKVGSILDPFGNTIGLIENPSFKLE